MRTVAGERLLKSVNGDGNRPFQLVTANALWGQQGYHFNTDFQESNGWIDGDAVALEHLTAVKRAGADVILTYFARDLAPILR